MIRKILSFSGILFLSASFCNAQVSSKRLAPKEVRPVTIDNIKYTAPTSQMGYIIAKDVITDSILWRKQIYTIQYNDGLEKDVQDDFIDSLYIKGKNLIIHTERNKVFSLRVKQ